MHKILVVVVAISAALFLIVPKIAGSNFNANADQYVESINAITPYSISVRDRKQGWFSSQMSLVVSLPIQELPSGASATGIDNASELNFEIDLYAQHGPLLIGEQFTIGLIEWTMTVLKPKGDNDFFIQTPSEHLYQMRGVIGLGQEVAFTDEIPAMDIVNDSQKNVLIEIAEYSGSGRYSNSGFSYQSEIPGNINVLQNGQSVLFSQDIEISTSIDGNLFQVIQNGLYDGYSVLSIKSTTANLEDGQPLFLAKDVKIEFESSLQKDAGIGAISILYGLTQLKFDDYVISDAEVVMKLSNLSVEFTKAYNEFNQQMLKAPDQVPELLNAFLQTSLLEQLQKDPEFNVSNFQFSIDGSQLKGFVNSGLSGVNELPETFESPGFWLEHGKVDSQIIIEKLIAEKLSIAYLLNQMKQNGIEENRELAAQQAPIMLEDLVQQGLLTQTESGFSLSILLTDGNLILNNNVLPM